MVDDFHYAAPAVSGAMTDLIERWPAETHILVCSLEDPVALEPTRCKRPSSRRGNCALAPVT